MKAVCDSNSGNEPLLRVMALHALAYCERLFYLEEVEEIRIANSDIYQGRRIHESIPETDLTTYTIENDRLGLKGKLDCVKRADGRWIPYELKKGHSAGKRNNGVWPSDELQLTAYAMLLEEHTGNEVPEGRIHYQADHKTVSLEMNAERYNQVLKVIERANELRQSTLRPPVTENEKLCEKCSLAPVCLPEEERFAKGTARKQKAVPRYFPEINENHTVHVITPGACVRKAGNRLVISNPDGESQEIPIGDVEAVVLHGSAQISTQAVHFCAYQEIPVHWVSGGGNYIGGITYGAGGVQRRIRQFAALQQPEIRLRLARKIVEAKVKSQLAYLMRATRRMPDRRAAVSNAVDSIKWSLSSIDKTTIIDELRGYEGVAGRAYFSALPQLISRDVEPELVPKGRTRRPPQDAFNALLSFLYSLLYRDIVQAVMTVGLDPCYGVLHTPRSAAYPLALDLQELFRVAMVDMPIVGGVNRKQFNFESDFVFVRSGPQVWLSTEGKKKAISLYEKRKADQWKHPVLKYSLSYGRTMELEVRLLEKEWSDAPGLFALSRLR